MFSCRYGFFFEEKHEKTKFVEQFRRNHTENNYGEEMKEIQLQEKTKAKRGLIEIYWFENEFIGLEKTLFHRIYVPLEPFDSGLDYEDQPVSTEIVFEWIELKLKDPTKLDGLTMKNTSFEEVEITVYVGTAHNICFLEAMELEEIGKNQFKIDCKLLIDFEGSGVGKNEYFEFSTVLELDTEIK
jgi:hypothetical protein